MFRRLLYAELHKRRRMTFSFSISRIKYKYVWKRPGPMDSPT